jgi:hypothetical protein
MYNVHVSRCGQHSDNWKGGQHLHICEIIKKIILSSWALSTPVRAIFMGTIYRTAGNFCTVQNFAFFLRIGWVPRKQEL